MKYIKNVFIILFILSHLFSCTTTSVLRLKPIEQESIFDGAKQIVKQERDGVKIVASYDGQYKKYMVFDIEVFNNTNQPLTVSPKDFLFTPLDVNRQAIRSDDGKHIYSYTGIEPQEQINLIRQEMAFQNAKIKRARVVNTVLFVGGIAALIASSGRYSESSWHTMRAAEEVVQVAQVKRVIDHANYYSKMDNLDRAGRVWTQESFRTTTIAPNSSIRGGVFLEADARAKYVKLDYYGVPNTINFIFEQWLEIRR